MLVVEMAVVQVTAVGITVVVVEVIVDIVVDVVVEVVGVIVVVVKVGTVGTHLILQVCGAHLMMIQVCIFPI